MVSINPNRNNNIHQQIRDLQKAEKEITAKEQLLKHFSSNKMKKVMEKPLNKQPKRTELLKEPYINYLQPLNKRNNE